MKNEKKHIDRLYQEGLKSFEATPSEAVWENISERIHGKEKKRRVIPLWIKLSGIAAGLLLLVTLGNKLFFQDDNTIPELNETIVDTNSKNNQNKKNNIDEVFDTKTEIASEENVVQEDSNEAEAKESLNNIQKKSKPHIVNKNESVVANSRMTNSKNINTVESQRNAIQEELSKAANDKSKVAKVENSTPEKLELESDLVKSKNKINTEEDKKGETVGELSIEDVIAENNQAKQNEDELTTKEKAAKRWSVASNVAPVYFNTLGSGSSIHSEFNNNAKSGNINMSYGVSANYAINDKINLRVGVNNVKLGYNTHDVFNLSSTAANPISSVAVKNIAVSKSASVGITSTNVGGMSFAQVPETLTNDFNASINQELGFFEIPLEIQYKITNTKLGINAIGGFSALFLSNNEIYSTFDGQTTLIGNATNINNLSYSANLGFGLNYKLSNKLNLNLEPMFKYQLNTFKNTSGNFKPYFIGVYSGLSFKF
ncbi:hypothetical protein MWU50_05480 [Flavobacteriaceae bacterium S0862]|nr:hypothetical protein [Flavobacteriaceae bacterium S0862]